MNMNRIYFEKYSSENDISDYEDLVFNEKLMVMNFGRIFTREEAKMFFDNMLKINRKHKEFGYFKVFEKTNNKLIGLGGIILNQEDLEAEVEYLLLPEYWGMGYGSEVLDELLNKAYKNKNIKKLIGITNPNNMASRKILLKQGFNSQKVYEIEDGSLAELFIKIVK